MKEIQSEQVYAFTCLKILLMYFTIKYYFGHICIYLVYLTSIRCMYYKFWTYFDFVQLMAIIALKVSDTCPTSVRMS